MMLKRLIYLGLSALVTAVVVKAFLRLGSVAFTRATGVQPPAH